MSKNQDDALAILARGLAMVCVRNTCIEDFHSRGSLTQADMAAFNKEVVNRIYTYLSAPKTMTEYLLMMADLGWDSPILDDDLLEAARCVPSMINLMRNKVT